jgi:hypothetical protein
MPLTFACLVSRPPPLTSRTGLCHERGELAVNESSIPLQREPSGPPQLASPRSAASGKSSSYTTPWGA